MESEIVVAIITGLLSLILGYRFGSFKYYKEQQQKAYTEALPDLLKYTFDPENREDEKRFNRALAMMWLHSSSEVARQLEKALISRNNPENGDWVPEMQKTILMMRTDVLPAWHQEDQPLSADEIKHFFYRSR